MHLGYGDEGDGGYSPLGGWIEYELFCNDNAFKVLDDRAFMISGRRGAFNGLPICTTGNNVYVDEGPRIGDNINSPLNPFQMVVKGAILVGSSDEELAQLKAIYDQASETSVREVLYLAEKLGRRVRIRFSIIDAYGQYMSDDPKNPCGMGASPEILLNPSILQRVIYHTYKAPSNWLIDLLDGDGFFECIGMPGQVLSHELGHFEDGLTGRVFDYSHIEYKELNSMTRENDFLKFHFLRPKNRYDDGFEFYQFRW